MIPLDLLGEDIRNRLVTEFLETGGIPSINLEVIEDRAFIDANDQGVSITAGSTYRIDTLFFYAEGMQGSHGYVGDLPLGLCFGRKRNDVLAMLNGLSKSGGRQLNADGKMVPKWDRFDFETYAVHLQFATNDESLELVTVMSSEVVPR